MSRTAVSTPRPPSLVFLLAQARDVIDEVAEALANAGSAVEIHVLRDHSRLDAHLTRVTPDIVVIDRASFSSSIETILLTGPLAGTPTLVLDETLDVAAQQSALTAGARTYLPRSPNRVQALRDAFRAANRRPALDRELEETQRHYNAILDAVSDGIFVLVNGRFQYANASFASALEVRTEDVLTGRPLIDFVPATEQLSIDESLSRIAMSSGGREVFELVLASPGGANKRFEVACRTSTLDGRRAVVGVARDVTAVRELQQEIAQSRTRAAHVERLRTLGELAAGVAHDFNNDLEAILGRIGIARTKAARGDSVDGDLAIVEAAAKDAVATVQRVRDYARPASGTAWGDIAVNELVGTVAELMHGRASEHVRFDLDLHAAPLIYGNVGELREVLMNIISNAFDAVGARGQIRVVTGEDDGCAFVVIEDNGPGIPDEVQRRIFEPFFTTKGDSGTGLGLSVSHAILKRHDIDVGLDSAVGRGTKFRLKFAKTDAAGPRIAVEPKANLRVLVVDDDPNVADLLRDLLEEHGHSAGLASEVGDALIWLEQNPCDLLITDLDLKGTSGWQLARRARETYPHMVIGLITGWQLGAPDHELRARGVDFVLTKPFTAEALLAALKTSAQ
ncbi:MAG: response regulator [Clostridia bacterium]|nr:response regulator [Deltaproteobacteria bacterium]